MREEIPAYARLTVTRVYVTSAGECWRFFEVDLGPESARGHAHRICNIGRRVSPGFSKRPSLCFVDRIRHEKNWPYVYERLCNSSREVSCLRKISESIENLCVKLYRNASPHITRYFTRKREKERFSFPRTYW